MILDFIGINQVKLKKIDVKVNDYYVCIPQGVCSSMIW